MTFPRHSPFYPVLRKLKKQLDVLRVRRSLAGAVQHRIVVGAAGIDVPGWILTEIGVLDLTSESDWARLFLPATLDAILAEHVWEHLTPDEGRGAARLCAKYLRPGGYVRVAVPDGMHPDPAYLESVKVNGSGIDDHKVLYDYKTLAALFRWSGFEVRLYEFFDESGDFHHEPWDARDGIIRRSLKFDRRNSEGRPNYTSIVLDAFKPRDTRP